MDKIFVKINNIDWEIKLVDEIEDGWWGATNRELNTIEIKKGLSSYVTNSTILHELVHAYIESYGFFYNRNRKLNEEDLCEFIACNMKSLVDIYNDALEKINKQITDECLTKVEDKLMEYDL